MGIKSFWVQNEDQTFSKNSDLSWYIQTWTPLDTKKPPASSSRPSHLLVLSIFSSFSSSRPFHPSSKQVKVICTIFDHSCHCILRINSCYTGMKSKGKSWKQKVNPKTKKRRQERILIQRREKKTWFVKNGNKKITHNYKEMNWVINSYK